MKRFIFLSFAFLGWVFYELSGGADFQPRVAELSTTPETGPETQNALASQTTRAHPVKAATLVASPARVQARPVAVNTDPLATRAVANAGNDIESVARLDQIRTSLSQGLALFPDAGSLAQPLTLASLEQGAAGLGVAAPVADDTDTSGTAQWAAPKSDIREITGTKVNMRDGPGTIYPVISRLTIGHEVEVLGDSGTGWLRLRSLPDRQTGWISASLVSKANR